MSRFRLPIFTAETLSQIIWGMENQDMDYMLNIKDGTLYSPEVSIETGEEPPQYLVELPTWNSSDGYQLMVSFTNSCKDPKLKERLVRELNSKSHGVFRRFRDVLSEDSQALQSWYDFKDAKMRAHIISWYREHFRSSRDDMEDDELYGGELLSEFEVKHLESLDSYCTALLENEAGEDPLKRKIFGAFTNREAYEICEGDDPKGALVFEIVDNMACVLMYNIEEKYRCQGLFNLLFDLFNRDMERRQIERVAMPFGPRSAFLKGVFAEHDTGVSEGESYAVYRVHEWNNGTFSSETAFVL